MSSLTYSTPPGFWETLDNRSHYSQAVRIPPNTPTIKISGQGAWDAITGAINTTDMAAHVEQTFANVDAVLKHAGAKGGWDDVYAARMFVVRMQEDGLLGALVEGIKKWTPRHKMVLTVIGTPELAGKEMRVEVEVEAVVGE